MDGEPLLLGHSDPSSLGFPISEWTAELAEETSYIQLREMK